MPVVLVGTLDTKADELGFVRDLLVRSLLAGAGIRFEVIERGVGRSARDFAALRTSTVQALRSSAGRGLRRPGGRAYARADGSPPVGEAARGVAAIAGRPGRLWASSREVASVSAARRGRIAGVATAAMAGPPSGSLVVMMKSTLRQRPDATLCGRQRPGDGPPGRRPRRSEPPDSHGAPQRGAGACRNGPAGTERPRPGGGHRPAADRGHDVRRDHPLRRPRAARSGSAGAGSGGLPCHGGRRAGDGRAGTRRPGRRPAGPDDHRAGRRAGRRWSVLLGGAGAAGGRRAQASSQVVSVGAARHGQLRAPDHGPRAIRRPSVPRAQPVRDADANHRRRKRGAGSAHGRGPRPCRGPGPWSS